MTVSEKLLYSVVGVVLGVAVLVVSAFAFFTSHTRTGWIMLVIAVLVLIISGKAFRSCILDDDETDDAGDFEAQIAPTK